MARRQHGFRPGRIAGKHPGLLAVSSAALMVGMSMTERLITRRSRRRSIQQRAQSQIMFGPAGAPEPRRAAQGRRDIALEALTASPPSEPAAAPPTKPPQPPPRRPGIQPIYRQGRQAVRRLREQAAEEDWQELRRQSSELWHGVQLLPNSRPKQTRKLARQARRLSILLGQDQELAVLGQLVREHPEQLGPEDLRLIGELIDRRRGELRRKAWRLAQTLYQLKPGNFARRLGLSG